jgi:hypothetical protein
MLYLYAGWWVACNVNSLTGSWFIPYVDPLAFLAWVFVSGLLIYLW